MNNNAPFSVPKRIRFHHCDPAGIVFYPQYFVLFHELIEDWFDRGLDVNYANFISSQRLGIPTVHIEGDFIAPSIMGETLELRLAVARLGTSSITLALSAYSGEVLRVTMNQVLVLFSLEDRCAVAIGADLREKMSRFAKHDDASGSCRVDKRTPVDK